jgi:Protein of Unknown function (DUF2784)
MPPLISNIRDLVEDIFYKTKGYMMEAKTLFLAAADFILLIHVFFVLFTVVGLLLILIGKFRGWLWVHNFLFRLAHLIGMAVVVLQSWLGVLCPLTQWEMALRAKAEDAVYAGSFIAHWLQSLLYFQAPEWLFIICYTVFGTLVLLSWFWVRPGSFTTP